MRLNFVADWSRLREGDRVNLYVKGNKLPNWENVEVNYVDEEGKFIKVWSDVGGHPRDSLLRKTYEVELLN
ncbi:hypothetical protein [Cryobacterium sp. GrIS_2_6]|uniref:hypothetical protein n=1 Tax=Cryobacterium sp. GrIS_2_6 TaxID=3162785 RepID=UPI002DF908AB|nr:hypothetical protein [Cryobacterium psychrotolerans]